MSASTHCTLVYLPPFPCSLGVWRFMVALPLPGAAMCVWGPPLPGFWVVGAGAWHALTSHRTCRARDVTWRHALARIPSTCVCLKVVDAHCWVVHALFGAIRLVCMLCVMLVWPCGFWPVIYNIGAAYFCLLVFDSLASTYIRLSCFGTMITGITCFSYSLLWATLGVFWCSVFLYSILWCITIIYHSNIPTYYSLLHRASLSLISFWALGLIQVSLLLTLLFSLFLNFLDPISYRFVYILDTGITGLFLCTCLPAVVCAGLVGCRITTSALRGDVSTMSSTPCSWDCVTGLSARYSGGLYIVLLPFLYCYPILTVPISPFHLWLTISPLVIYFPDTIRRTPHFSWWVESSTKRVELS